MKVLVIGGVAAGTKAAAKLKREDRSAEVTIVTKSRDISYAGCGLPYYVGDVIPDKEQLIVNTPAKFAALTGVKVLTEREVIALHPDTKEAIVKNQRTGAEESYSFDTCIIASGASAIVPRVSGADLPGVFTGGDCATGPSTVIRAIAAGKVAAHNIDEYLGFHHIISADVEIPEPRLDDRIPCGRVNMTEREVCKRIHDFDGVEICMTEQEAKQEASRCLRCDHFGFGIFKGGRETLW